MRGFLLLALLCQSVVLAQSELGDLELAELYIGAGSQVTFYPSALPPNVDLPLPEEATLLGSIAIASEGVKVLLDLDAFGENWYQASLDHMGESFSAAGWQLNDPTGPDIFVSAGPVPIDPFAEYCSPDGSQAASVDAFSRSLSSAFVILRLDACYTREDRRAPYPRLVLPEGISESGSGSGGNENSFDARVRYSTDLSPDEIFKDFAGQLSAQGWRTGPPERDGDTVRAELSVEHDGSLWQGELEVSSLRTEIDARRVP